MFTVYKAKWILPANEKTVENGAIVVENGKIKAVLSEQELKNYENYEIIDYGNALITPGFVNLHAHLQYTDTGKTTKRSFLAYLLDFRKKWVYLFRKNKGFVSWIIDLVRDYFVWNQQEKINSFKNGLKQIILSGTTCVAQLSGEEDFVEILNTAPIKSYIFLEVFADSEKSATKNFKNLKDRFEKLSKKCGSNVHLGISPHSIYNVHQSLWEKISEYSTEKNILIHTHLAESEAEMDWVKGKKSEITLLHKFVGCNSLKPYQTTDNPVIYLAKLGVLNERFIAAHTNQLDDKELEFLASFGTSIAHCPRSNIYLHNKTLNTGQVYKTFEGRIGLGTDSLFSNYDLNILNEAKYIKYNSTSASTTLDVLKILDMLTIKAAQILRLDKQIGSLETGKDADFLVFKLTNGENYLNLLDKESPDDVYISGKTIVKNKSLLEQKF